MQQLLCGGDGSGGPFAGGVSWPVESDPFFSAGKGGSFFLFCRALHEAAADFCGASPKYGNRFFHNSVPLEDSEISSLPPDWRQTGPEAAVILEEESRQMREQVIALLSPLEKETLQLYLKGFSYEEMAKKLKCPEKSVDNALQRIRRKLRKAQSRNNS